MARSVHEWDWMEHMKQLRREMPEKLTPDGTTSYVEWLTYDQYGNIVYRPIAWGGYRDRKPGE